MDFVGLSRWWTKFQFGGKQRERAYRKLSNFLVNNVSLTEALRIMYMHASDDGRKTRDPIAVILAEWRRSVSNGASFGNAIAGWVPDGDRILIGAGEQSGLASAIQDAVLIQKAVKKIKGTIIGGLAYPVILVLSAVGFMVMFAVRIVPAFDEVVPKEQWEGTAGDMAMIADFVNIWLLPIGIGVIAAIATIVYTLPRWVGRFRAIADRYPPWSIYRLYSGAGFMLVVSALSRSGVAQTEILRILQKGATPWYDERITGALRHVSNGENLGQALWLTGLGYPDVQTVKDLRSYAEQAGFDEILRELGEQWVEESIEKITQQVGMLRNLSFVVLGVVVATIAVGIFAMEQTVTGSL